MQQKSPLSHFVKKSNKITDLPNRSPKGVDERRRNY